MDAHTLTSFQDVIDLWPTKAAFAADLHAYGDQEKLAPAREWYRRGSIPPTWFDSVLAAAEARGFSEVTYRLLTGLYKGLTEEEAI